MEHLQGFLAFPDECSPIWRNHAVSECGTNHALVSNAGSQTVAAATERSQIGVCIGAAFGDFQDVVDVGVL